MEKEPKQIKRTCRHISTIRLVTSITVAEKKPQQR